MSLGAHNYTTDFSRALKPFFAWCLSVFRDTLDDESRAVLTAMKMSRDFRLNVTVHHRTHKLWEEFARRGSSHSMRVSSESRILGITRRVIEHPIRPDNVINVSIPIDALAEPVRLARIFIHEFAHVMQHYSMWEAAVRGEVPPNSAWAYNAAERDAEEAEHQFVYAVAFRIGVMGTGLSTDGITAAVQAAITAQWKKTLARSARLRDVHEMAKMERMDQLFDMYFPDL